MPTATEVAEWMLRQLRREKVLYQQDAALEMQKYFGEEFVYYNQSGNVAISKGVLAEFKRLSGDEVVWVRSDRHWRQRGMTDVPGRKQD
jgi:hypothetical protein